MKRNRRDTNADYEGFPSQFLAGASRKCFLDHSPLLQQGAPCRVLGDEIFPRLMLHATSVHATLAESNDMSTVGPEPIINRAVTRPGPHSDDLQEDGAWMAQRTSVSVFS